MTPTPIAFGTSGWRGILGDEFTCFNLRRVTRAVARYFCQEIPVRQPTIFVGFDTRFLSEHLAHEVVAVLAAEGVKPVLSTTFTPTPALAHTVLHRKFDGGINLTASHNPAEYSGIKLSTRDGAPAPSEVTRRIESLLNEIRDGSAPPPLPASKVKTLDPAPEYRKAVLKHVRSKVIARARLKLVCDPVNGTGSGYLPPLLSPAKSLFTIRAHRDVTFGGHPPDCTEKELSPLIQEVRRRQAHLGLATDGDADRFGVVDRGGRFVPPNWVLALIADYLLETREPRLGIARTVATTRLLDDVAASHSVPLFETPVGFKYIGQLIDEDKVSIGGEESAGLSIRNHFPEKDGILACLLVAEMVARRGVSLKEMLEQVYSEVGRIVNGRIGVRLTPELQQGLASKLAGGAESFGGRRVVSVNRVDGAKFILEDGSWILMRPSGTEPLVRIYAEASNEQELEVLLESGRKYILG